MTALDTRLLVDRSSSLILELEQAQQLFVDRLEFMGLGMEYLEQQTSAEDLLEGLRQIEHCIDNPEVFRLLEVRQGERLHRYISHEGVNLNFDTIFLPILLERKRLILGRLEAFQVDEKVRDLHASVIQFTEGASQSKLISEIDELLELSQKWRQQFDLLAQDQQRLKEQTDRDKLALLERRHKIWLSFLGKESVATIIGALLLLLIAVVQIVLIFAGLQPSETLNNSFLLLLGYFFGQSVQANLRRDV